MHIVFGTKHRKHFIDDKIETHLHNYLGGICKNWECNPVQVGGFTNHVHILSQISRKIAPMKLIQELKQSSSKWIKTKGGKYQTFYWQDGYGAFSVSQSQVENVVEYIRDQHEHHLKITFKEEFVMLLKKHKVEYDERYLWDYPTASAPLGLTDRARCLHRALPYVGHSAPSELNKDINLTKFKFNTT